MKSLNIRKGALFGAVAAMVISTVFAAPAKAAADDLITPNDGTCDYAAASLGHGSPSDPFQIGTSKQLAEISDCSRRQVTITGAVGDGTSVTYTADNSFGVGQAVQIASVNPSTFNAEVARVTAATSTTFTVASSVTDSYVDSGAAQDKSTFYSVVADIDLSAGNDVWNNVDSAVITNATGDGSTITYTGANTFEVGQEVVIKNVAPIEYSVGNATIISATATEFTVSGSASSTYLSGGEANSHGWLPITNGNGFTFNGNGHTISGLTIHRGQNNIGLFEVTENGSFNNFIMTDIEVDATGSDYTVNTGALVGYSSNMNFENIKVSGNVIGKMAAVGMLVGVARRSNILDIEASGDVRLGRISSFSNGQDQPYQIGGVVGSTYGTIDEVHSSVNVYGYATNNVEDSRTYGRQIGGVVGDAGDGTIRNSSSTGVVYGAQDVGGLIGKQCCGDIYNSFATGDVYGSSNRGGSPIYSVGGFIGNYDCCGGLRDSYSTGNVIVENTGSSSTWGIGGFIGSNDCCSVFSDTYSTGDVTVTAGTSPAEAVGGYLGYQSCCAAITNSHSSGDVSVSNGKKVGGFIGETDSENSIFDSYSSGDVTVAYDGEAYVGGFVGHVPADLAAVRVSASGNVTVTPFTEGQSASAVGGLFGYVEEGPLFLKDAYFKGTVSGTDKVGGLIGWTREGIHTVRNVYVSASVTASGVAANVDAVANGYWSAIENTSVFDTTTAGISNNAMEFVGKTTSQLQTKATFTDLGWNFNAENGVWTIASDVNGGMPTLVGPQAVTDGGDGGTTPEVVEKVVSLSSKNGVLSLSAATKFKVRTYTVNLPNTFAKKQVKVRVLRAGKVVKVLKTAKLNKGGNLTFISKYSLKKGDVVQVRDIKKVRASVTIS